MAGGPTRTGDIDVTAELPTNLRLLSGYHRRSAREAAEVTRSRGAHALPADARQARAGLRALLATDAIYGLMLPEGDPYKFAQELATPAG